MKDRVELPVAFAELFDEVWAAAELDVQNTTRFQTRVSDILREQVQLTFLGRADVQRYDPRRDSDCKVLRDEFRRVAFPVAVAAAHDFMEKLTNSDTATRKLLFRTSHEKDDPKAYQSERAERENRELVNFVAGRIVPLKRILSEGDDLKPGRHGPTHGVRWADLCEEWNQTHELRFRSEEALRRRYYRTVERLLTRTHAEEISSALQAPFWQDLLGLDTRAVESIPEGLFARFESQGDGTQLASQAEEFRARARALREESLLESTSPAARAANEEKADAYERVAQSLLRVSQVRDWVVVGGSPLRRRARGSSSAGTGTKKKQPH